MTDYEAYFQKQAELEAVKQFKLLFYAEILPMLEGKTFDRPRGYGHATYKIIGDHADWRATLGAQKVYFHFDNRKIVETGNSVTDKTLCVAIVRLGGYDGPPKTTFSEVILAAAAGRIGQ